jgi:hypothetical protein
VADVDDHPFLEAGHGAGLLVEHDEELSSIAELQLR